MVAALAEKTGDESSDPNSSLSYSTRLLLFLFIILLGICVNQPTACENDDNTL